MNKLMRIKRHALWIGVPIAGLVFLGVCYWITKPSYRLPDGTELFVKITEGTTHTVRLRLPDWRIPILKLFPNASPHMEFPKPAVVTAITQVPACLVWVSQKNGSRTKSFSVRAFDSAGARLQVFAPNTRTVANSLAPQSTARGAVYYTIPLSQFTGPSLNIELIEHDAGSTKSLSKIEHAVPSMASGPARESRSFELPNKNKLVLTEIDTGIQSPLHDQLAERSASTSFSQRPDYTRLVFRSDGHPSSVPRIKALNIESQGGPTSEIWNFRQENSTSTLVVYFLGTLYDDLWTINLEMTDDAETTTSPSTAQNDTNTTITVPLPDMESWRAETVDADLGEITSMIVSRYGDRTTTTSHMVQIPLAAAKHYEVISVTKKQGAPVQYWLLPYPGQLAIMINEPDTAEVFLHLKRNNLYTVAFHARPTLHFSD